MCSTQIASNRHRKRIPQSESRLRVASEINAGSGTEAILVVLQDIHARHRHSPALLTAIKCN